MKIILTGATGLIGSRFEELKYEDHEIIPLSSSQGIDITNKDSISGFLQGKEADLMLHFAGKTDVDGCETDKQTDLKILNIEESGLIDLNVRTLDSSVWKNEKTAFAVNTIGTKNLYEASQEKGMKFVYISSDFVFSGNDGPYDEESRTDPVDWYGTTKLFGEKIIDVSRNLIVRLAFPYGQKSPVKKDLVWKLYDLLSSRDEVGLISDQIITPTFIDDIINGLDFLFSKDAVGLYHLTGSSSLSPMQIGEKIKDTFSLQTKINPSLLEDVYRDKAARPHRSIILNDKLKNLGFVPKTFEQGLELIK